MNPIRVLLVDDHPIVREGLNLFLTEEPESFEVVGVASDGEEAVALAERLDPDVILMDVLMPRMNGIEALHRIRRRDSDARVLMLTTFADEAQIVEALRGGATGYLLKDVSKADLIAAIRAAASGRPTLHPDAQAHMIRMVTTPAASSPLEALNHREMDVLRLIAHGYSNKGIAAALSLSVGTIKGHVHSILAKLGVEDRTQAALLAVRHGVGEAVSAPAGTALPHTR